MANDQITKLEEKVKDLLTNSKLSISEKVELWRNVGIYLHTEVTTIEAELLNAKTKLPKKEA